MSNQPDDYDRLYELLDASLRGETTATLSDELATLLRSSAEARRRYLDYVDDTVTLVWRGTQSGREPAPLAVPAPPVLARPRVWRRRLAARVAAGLAAAAACLALIGPWWVVRQQRNGAPADRDFAMLPSGVATLVRATNARWRPADPTPADFARLKVGNRIELDAGQVELLFDSGVELVARAPCRIEISSDNSIIAERGAIFARVGEAGHGFAVQTPITRLIDLGTEFGVEIDEGGQTDVAVFTGIVDVGGGDQTSAKTERLFQGEALRVSDGGATERLTAFEDLKFPTPGASAAGTIRPPVIAEVRDNIADGHVKKAYRIVRRGLWEDSLAFVDRQHEWNGVDERGLPRALLGGEYVMPFNDDKFFDELRVEVDVARPATVYVLISDTVPEPSWLIDGFDDTGWSIGLDEGPFEWRPGQTTEKGPGQSIETVFSVWKRVVTGPETLKLGGVNKHPRIHEGYNMYGIVAVPLVD